MWMCLVHVLDSVCYFFRNYFEKIFFSFLYIEITPKKYYHYLPFLVSYKAEKVVS